MLFIKFDVPLLNLFYIVNNYLMVVNTDMLEFNIYFIHFFKLIKSYFTLNFTYDKRN